MSKKPTSKSAGAAAYSGRMPLIVGLAVLVVTALPDLFLHKHTYFHAYEAWPGFFALLGLGAVAVLVGLARLIGALVRRGEDYYG
ncbi:hypothetical protein [Geoalkalibacter sp.]|uniref:hypothetical protein n=1 Tax=Geoalkalibacter sp. TaxID=3041440 RepID=UPI00272DFD64|nr:hypothetical protein [Geoalkalibacter sp.]